MVHCITLLVPVSGLCYAPALDWYKQGDTVYHINPESVLSIYHIALHCYHLNLFSSWLTEADLHNIYMSLI